MATTKEKVKAAEQKYNELDARADTLLARFINWRGSTAVVAVILILAVIGAIYLTTRGGG